MQTIALARLSPGSFVTSNDIHQPFLDDVEERAKKAGVKNRIATLRASIDDLPFRA